MLLERTKYLLENRPRTLHLEKIAQETGLGMSWLKMLSAGRIVNPGVTHIETLYVFLSGKELDV